MARLKINIAGRVIARFEVPVRITDINYGGHAGNQLFVAYLHEARMQWLAQHGFTELNIEGTGLIMSDLAVEFKAEVFYGDKLFVELSCGEITAFGFELFYELSTFREDKKLTVARAKTGMVCYDYRSKKPAPVTHVLLQLLQAR